MILQLICHVISAAILVLHAVVSVLARGKTKHAEGAFRGINVIVPTYNEGQTIGACLESLMKMEPTNPPHATYVLDDNSSDGTAQIASTYSGSVCLIQRPQRTSKADALNHAVRNIPGDIFAIVDGDCVVEPRWLGGLISPLSDDSVGISTGSVLVENRNDSALTRMQSCEMAFLCHQLIQPVERVGMLYSINGNNFAFSRSCWEKIGGFDPARLTEDTDFAIRTRAAGLRVRSAESKVFTRVPSRFRELLRQRRRWYVGWYQNLSSTNLLAGAIFILLFYYAFFFFAASFSLLSPAFLFLYYIELSITYRRAYGRVSTLNPLAFIVIAPFFTTATILAAIPSVLRGKGRLTVERHW